MFIQLKPEQIEITPELQEHFDMFGKIVRTVATVSDLRKMVDDSFLSHLGANQKVLVVADYERFTLDIEELS